MSFTANTGYVFCKVTVLDLKVPCDLQVLKVFFVFFDVLSDFQHGAYA